TNAGSNMYFAKPRWDEVNGNEPSLQALMQPASAYQGWVETGNAVQNGQAFAKQGGSIGWDSTAYTVNGYTTCHIGAKVVSTGGHAVVGFADQPAASNLSGSAFSPPGHFFELYNAGGTWNYVEAGGSATSLVINVATTDLAEMTYDGTTVTYFINKVSLRTVTSA